MNKWHVRVQSVGETIHVFCGKGFMSGPSEYVFPPVWLERLRGVTHQMKVDKAIDRVQKACDRRNAEDHRGKTLAEQYPERKIEMEQLEVYAIAKRIIEQELNGLPVNEAKWVLQETKTLLDSTHVVNTSSPSFLAFVEELRNAAAESN